jgi:hypothetical protein
MEGLLYFIWEREAIRLARENGHSAPWTKDRVLDKYKFTNIRRSDDRVSQWVIDKLITPNSERADLWFTLLIARLINWPPTLQALIDKRVIPCTPQEFDADMFEHTLERIKNDGKKVYSGAYMLYPTKMEPGGNKSRAVAKYIIGSAVENAESINSSLWEAGATTIERFVAELSKCFGISTFIAGQVAADLTYALGHLDTAEDLYSYAPVGPGSSRGLNYLLGKSPYATWKQKEFNAELSIVFSEIIDKLEIVDMTLHDVQNCMCEFSKYCRAVLSEGKPKTNYQPETEF